ncbi:MAG: DUF1826 domain-containing protein [Pseudomonadota bacterium]
MRTEDPSLPLDETPTHFVRREVRGAGIGVGVADKPEGLSAIHSPGCAASIWRRHPLPSFQAWLDGLDPKILPSGRMTLPADTVHTAVLDLCDRDGTPAGAMRDHLVDDIAALATLFAELMGSALLKLRLERVATNSCTKFHIDAITGRLICTYRGTGTQYGILTEGDVPRRIFTVPTGSPIILRGTLWPQSPPAGVMHRSPPIEGTGETRLVLILDPVQDLENGEQTHNSHQAKGKALQ